MTYDPATLVDRIDHLSASVVADDVFADVEPYSYRRDASRASNAMRRRAKTPHRAVSREVCAHG